VHHGSAARAEQVIDQACRASGDVLLFAHGHILRVIAARWIGMPVAGDDPEAVRDAVEIPLPRARPRADRHSAEQLAPEFESDHAPRTRLKALR